MSVRSFVIALLGFMAVALPGFGQAADALNERQRTVLNGLARDRYTGRWIELNTNQLAAMHRRAETYLTDLRKYHRIGGLVVSARFADTNRTAVTRYEATPDSAAWTAVSLAAYTFRYVVTRDTEMFKDLRASLDGIDRLLKVSGKPGYLARFSARADDPAYRPDYATWGGADPVRNGFGKLAHAGTGDYGSEVWLGGPSRDHYAAVNYGLMTTYQLVRDQTIRSQISNTVTLMLNRLEKDGWRIDDGQGNRTYVTPLLQAALLRSGATINPARFRKEFELRAAEYLKLPPPSVLQYSDYAPNIFNMASLNVLCRLEINEPSRKLLFQERLTETMRQAESHLNPFLAGCYLEGFEKIPSSSALLVTFQGVLYEFPDPPRWATPVDQSKNRELNLLDANGQRWSKFTLQLPERPPAAFQWAASPYQLAGGDGELVSHPGVDYLVGFWIGRDTSLIPSEDYVAVVPERRRTTVVSTNTPAVTNRPARKAAP